MATTSTPVRALALVMALALPITGCASMPSRAPTVACAELDAGAVEDRPVAAIDEDTCEADEAGAVQIRHRHGRRVGRAFAWVGVALLLPVIVIADLLILPATAPRRRSFCCTRTVVRWCR